MRDKEFYTSEPIWQLSSFGIFAFNVYEAAEFVAKIQCLEYDTDKKVPDEADQYSLDNPILPDLLKVEIAEYTKAILSGIDKGTLKTLHVSRDIHDEIDCDETYIDMDSLYEWFSERGVEISGDFYVQYQDDRLEVSEAAIEAIVFEEYKLRHGIKKEFGSPKDKKIFQLEMKILELEKDISSKTPDINPQKELKTRERDTLLKMIIGMAIKGYVYNPTAKKNTAITEIESDLKELGIPVSDDTIRKWIKEALEIKPRPPPPKTLNRKPNTVLHFLVP